MKVVINTCFGGFSVSDAVMDKLGLPYTFADEIAAGKTYYQGDNYLSNEDLGITSENHYAYRADPRLVAAVEELGKAASSSGPTELTVVEIPDDVEWEIDEYDGNEQVAEKHRTWS